MRHRLVVSWLAYGRERLAAGNLLLLLLRKNELPSVDGLALLVVVGVVDDDVLSVDYVVVGYRSLLVGASVGGRGVVEAFFGAGAPVVGRLLWDALVLGGEL